ncbi:BEACH domain-containing protein LvsA-like protein [Tanacetum coccineum]|uniref:BEACH domain-containing protein LvsA-like protein n=1 Tax=Tanacetum coccineum TaxID=301880 RepID=A0ABQ5GHQ2_9ASTR
MFTNLTGQLAQVPSIVQVKRFKSKTPKEKISAVEIKKTRSEVRHVSDDEDDVNMRRPETARARRNADDDAKAENFITKFREQLKLQRMDSINRHNDMLRPSTMITKDTFNSNATVTNMTLTEPAPSIVTSSDNERLVVHEGANKTLYSNARSSVVTNMTTTEPGPSTVTSDNDRRLIQLVTNMTSTEAGPSTITFPENETHLYTAANDDVQLDYELTDSILQITNTQVVEDCNGKPTDAPNGDDLIYFDLEALSTLDDLILDGFDMFTAEVEGIIVRAILFGPSCYGSGTVADRLDHLLPSHILQKEMRVPSAKRK